MAVAIGLIALSISACDFLDPTEVRNPQTTEESLRQGGTGATVPFLNGVVQRYADAMEEIAYFTDVVSDNYDNIATFISPAADFPSQIVPQDLTLNGADEGPYHDVQELRALADFVLNSVIPNDAQATAEQTAEATFYRGMGYLLAAENFNGVPIADDGPRKTPEELTQLAIDDFNAAVAISQHGDFPTRIQLVLARAHRLLGNVNAAEAAANQALAGDANFTFAALYDAAFFVNRGWNFAVSRNLNDIQPLPRLDFLDPKYTLRDSPINSVKMEEAHLILAEVALSKNDLPGAVRNLANAITLAKSRPTSTFVDRDPRPNNLTGTFRPQFGTVQASPTSPAIAGLILPRGGNAVQVPTVSGTSLDAAAVLALTNPVEIFRTLYLARQEIFFFEGRRMNDLGIRLPMMEREVQTNASIEQGDVGTVSVVPAYIPPSDDLDDFTFDAANANTVIATDMNAVLAANRVSPFPMPF
jgi:hypothetical protein